MFLYPLRIVCLSMFLSWLSLSLFVFVLVQHFYMLLYGLGFYWSLGFSRTFIYKLWNISWYMLCVNKKKRKITALQYIWNPICYFCNIIFVQHLNPTDPSMAMQESCSSCCFSSFHTFLKDFFETRISGNKVYLKHIRKFHVIKCFFYFVFSLIFITYS